MSDRIAFLESARAEARAAREEKDRLFALGVGGSAWKAAWKRYMRTMVRVADLEDYMGVEHAD